MYYIYGLFKEINDTLFYIGITKDIKSRIKNHLGCYCNNKFKNNIIKKHKIYYKILWTVSSHEEAIERESFLISWFGKIIDKTGTLANILDEHKDVTFWRNQSVKYTAPEAISHLLIIKNRNISINQYSKEINIAMNTIYTWNVKYKILPKIKTNRTKKQLQEIRNKFINSGLNKFEFSKQENIPYHRIKVWFSDLPNCDKRLSDEQKIEIIKLRKNGLSYTSIAKQVNSSSSVISRYLRKNKDLVGKIITKSKTKSKIKSIKPKKEKMYSQEFKLSHINKFEELNIPIREYSKKFDIPRTNLKRWLIEFKKDDLIINKSKPITDYEIDIIYNYLKQGNSIRKTCILVNRSKNAIRNLIKNKNWII